MLRDIPNPFQQVVTRGRRPSHPGLGGSAEGTVPGRVIIPVRVPPNKDDVHVDVGEGQQHAIVSLDESWRGHDGDSQVILATASLMYKASQRVVSLALPGAPPQIWRLDLSSDPDPTPGYSAWRLPSSASATKMEMSFRLRADR